MNNRDKVEMLLEQREENALFVAQDGLDEAVIGLTYRDSLPVVVYSEEAVLQQLMSQGYTWTDAAEHYENNIKGSYVGPQTPVFVEMAAEV